MRAFLGRYLLNTESVQALTSTIVDFVVSARGTPDRQFTRWLACLNPHSVIVGEQDLRFGDALRRADFLVADGVGVVWAARMLGFGRCDRVTGMDVFLAVLNELQVRGGGRIFLLGASIETLGKIEARITREFPKVVVSGMYSPPYVQEFDPDELGRMAQQVNAARADVLFVSLSAPKQEKTIVSLQGRLQVPFSAAVGAVFDFYCGNVKRSPAIFQHVGLEWLPRLLQEPRRLWRRTFISAPKFVLLVAAYWLRGAWGRRDGVR